ncbi:HAD family hydrolase [Fusobacterium varium]
MKEIKLIIFDMDGLLLDTERLSNIAWIEAGKNMEIDITYNILRRIKGGNFKNTVNVLMSFLDEEKCKKFIEEKNRIQVRVIEKEGIRLKKGVLELLTFLKEKEIKITVATSTGKELATRELQDTGIYKYFDGFVFGDEVKNGKPNPEIFLAACKKFDVVPENAVVLEDSVLGLKAAASGGIKCIVVEDTVQLTKEENRLPYRKCESLLEVRDLFKEVI